MMNSKNYFRRLTRSSICHIFILINLSVFLSLIVFPEKINASFDDVDNYDTIEVERELPVIVIRTEDDTAVENQDDDISIEDTSNTDEGEESDISIKESLGITEDEEEMLRYMVEAEAYGIDDINHKMMIASVVLNRVISDKYPNTVESVVYDDSQFYSLYNVESHKLEPSDSTNVAVDIILGMTQDEVKMWSGGAMYFYNPDISGNISWFDNKSFVDDYEGNQFFAD